MRGLELSAVNLSITLVLHAQIITVLLFLALIRGVIFNISNLRFDRMQV